MLFHQVGVGGKVRFNSGSDSLLSLAYIIMARPICRLLLLQAMPLALSFARARAGSSMAARMAMMAMTTKSSIRVNPSLGHGLLSPTLSSRGGEGEKTRAPRELAGRFRNTK